MPAVVRSVNSASAEPVPGLKRPSGIRKRPVDVIEVRDPGPKRGGLGSGVVGDAIISRKHHGGTTQAVYAVAREELDWWGEHLGRDLADGIALPDARAATPEVLGEGEETLGPLHARKPDIPLSPPCLKMTVHTVTRRRAHLASRARRGLHHERSRLSPAEGAPSP